MPKNKKQFTKVSWYVIAIAILFVALPSSILSKLLVEDINPYLVSALRYAIVALALLPFVIDTIRKKRKLVKKKLPAILICSLLPAIGVPIYYAALAMSSVSFTEVIGLLGPITFAIISILITKDRISTQAIAGLLFAILGAFVVIGLPIWLGSGAVITFGILPAVLCLINVALTAFVPVYYRKMDEEGLPMTMTIGITFFFTCVVSFVMAIFDAGPAVLAEITNLTVTNWLVLIYLAIGVTVVVRIIRVKAYEHIGTAAHASINYLYCILGIIAPILVLGENLTWEMIIGGILIIIGVILTGRHPQKHKHFHKHRFVKGHI